MPWFAVNELKPYISSFKSITTEKQKRAIQKGANRLLSMQTHDGGLAYWPGGRDSEPWASSYGGYALILAKQHGANIPDEAVNQLCDYLIKKVANPIESDSRWDLESAARALHLLALANKAQPASANVLFEKRKQMDMSGRAYLALAMHTADPQNADALKLLTEPFEQKEKAHWMRYSTDKQMHALALCQISPEHEKTHQLIDEIARSTDKRNHWGNTWANASTIRCMAAYAKLLKANGSKSEIVLSIDGKEQKIALNANEPMKTIVVPISSDIKLSASSKQLAYVNTVIHSKPELISIDPTSKNGVAIKKEYFRILKDGSREKLVNPMVGDVVEVELEVHFTDSINYVVIDDPLPTTFECVNSEFKSQSTHVRGSADQNWRVSHQELRDDRALFFFNKSWSGKSQKLSYLARITASGHVAVPPAKVEAMYDPNTYGLSGANEILCRPRKDQ